MQNVTHRLLYAIWVALVTGFTFSLALVAVLLDYFLGSSWVVNVTIVIVVVFASLNILILSISLGLSESGDTGS